MKKIAALVLVFMATFAISGCDYVPEAVKEFFRPTSGAYTKGEFMGSLAVRFESFPTGDGQTVELVQLIDKYGYKDSAGKEWEVPAGEISDGASIPWALWSVVGGPFSGPYRNAAVVHDYYCNVRTRPYQEVHKMFYEAALKAGTSKGIAKLMYMAILADGPTWKTPKGTGKKKMQNQGSINVSPLVKHAAATQTKIDLSKYPLVMAQAAPKPGTAAAVADPKTCKEMIDKVKVNKMDAKAKYNELKLWIERNKPNLVDIQKCVANLRRANLTTN